MSNGNKWYADLWIIKLLSPTLKKSKLLVIETEHIENKLKRGLNDPPTAGTQMKTFRANADRLDFAEIGLKNAYKNLHDTGSKMKSRRGQQRNFLEIQKKEALDLLMNNLLSWRKFKQP